MHIWISSGPRAREHQAFRAPVAVAAILLLHFNFNLHTKVRTDIYSCPFIWIYLYADAFFL